MAIMKTPTETTNINDGKQLIYDFENNYGASVVFSRYSYGHEEGLIEVAVLHNGELCYDTHITDDVIGHLTASECYEIVEQIENLAPKDQK